jgi:hypothetical protein
MSKCPAHGGEFRKGVTVTLLEADAFARGTRSRRARVCMTCASSGLVIVASKLPPVKVEKIARPDGYEKALRQLQVLARAAKAMALGDEEDHFNSKAEGIEGAIEVIKREMGS